MYARAFIQGESFGMIGFRELFGYFKTERTGLIQLFEKLSDEEFTKDRGLSFGSIKNVFIHTVMVEDVR
jgi:uncharacterized damage-inducible protein DinB